MKSLALEAGAGVAAERKPERSRRGEVLVYVLLALLPLAAWQISRRELFRPGDDVGYWLGVAGGCMMLLLFSYPLRKHLRFARNWGRVKGWFLLHVLLGIGGPLLILLHTTFRVGSLNAAVALFSMVVVALSGVVGRFLYTRVHRERNGRQVSFDALRTKAGLDQAEARSRLAFAPAVEERLVAFARAELQARPGVRTWLRQVLVLPARQWFVYRRCVRDLQEPLARLGRHAQWSDTDRRRRERLARKLVRRYLAAVVSVAEFTACERLFSLWHVAHIPFVYMLVLSAVVHVVAVHAY